MKALIIVISLLLTACSTNPVQIVEGEQVRTGFNPLKHRPAHSPEQCEQYVMPDHIVWEVFDERERVIQNTMRMAKEGGVDLLGDKSWSTWVRDRFAMQCIQANLILLTNEFGQNEIAVEVENFVLISWQNWAIPMFSENYFDQIPFTSWREIGHPDGTWYQLVDYGLSHPMNMFEEMDRDKLRK